MREGSANGKVILFGEYAVLSGATGYAVGLKDFKLTVQLPLVPESDTLDSLLQTCVIDSNIPQGSGLGSSAALSVALARCIKPSASDETIFKVAKCFDDQFHDGSSGIDVFASMQGGLIKSHQGHFEVLPNELLQRLKRFKFSIIDTNSQRKVKEVKSTIDKNFYNEFIQEASRISKTFTDKLINDTLQLQDMINFFNEYQFLLKKLKVSNELIDSISRKFLNEGIGVKITGGGGGGCLLLVHDENVSKSLILEIICDPKLKLYYDISI